MGEIINGIQQIGIGVTDVKSVFNWYRKHLGFDVLLFKDEAVATLMTKYTNGNAERRDAYLSLNMKGGGGLEIWQFKDRKPSPAKVPIQMGDLGIFSMKIRSANLEELHSYLKKLKVAQLTDIVETDYNQSHFYFIDPFDNQVQIVSDAYVFSKSSALNGGVMGAVIGVSNMECSIEFYRKLFGYNIVLCDSIIDWKAYDSDNIQKIRKVILCQNREYYGGFGDLLGPTQIELVQVLDRTPVKIYEDRLWGDLGYIHLCFDVQGMQSIKDKAHHLNYPFTVDSSTSFDMGDTAGHFGYIEDPDGTLIELVETHKVPLLKSLGIYLNLKTKNPRKTLPKWLIKLLALNRVKQDL